MIKDNIEIKIKNILSNCFNIKIHKIQNSSSLIQDLGADSLDIIELIMTLEEKFNVKIYDNEIDKITMVQEVINLIKSKLNML